MKNMIDGEHAFLIIFDEASGFDNDLYKKISEAISCGYYHNHTNVHSAYACKICGRMLCESCGKDVGYCDFHEPIDGVINDKN